MTVPRSAVLHLVGRRGQAIQQTENSLGVLIGIMDGRGNEATVTLIGPLAQVESARDIIATLAVGARSVLTRLKNPRLDPHFRTVRPPIRFSSLPDS